MYFVDDKRAAICEIQRYLFVIGQEMGLTHLSVDGFYSEETELAVREFQRIHFLSETGAVDRETFDMIYGEYDRISKDKKNNESELFAIDYPMRIGSVGNSVSDLNGIIRELSEFYTDLPTPRGDFYSQNTEDAIKMLQRILKKTETGETTLEFYVLLRKNLHSLQKTQTLNISS